MYIDKLKMLYGNKIVDYFGDKTIYLMGNRELIIGNKHIDIEDYRIHCRTLDKKAIILHREIIGSMIINTETCRREIRAYTMNIDNYIVSISCNCTAVDLMNSNLDILDSIKIEGMAGNIVGAMIYEDYVEVQVGRFNKERKIWIDTIKLKRK